MFFFFENVPGLLGWSEARTLSRVTEGLSRGNAKKKGWKKGGGEPRLLCWSKARTLSRVTEGLSRGNACRWRARATSSRVLFVCAHVVKIVCVTSSRVLFVCACVVNSMCRVGMCGKKHVSIV